MKIENAKWHTDLEGNNIAILCTKDGIWKVSNNLGHSNTVTTTATYGHWLNDYEEDPEETAREDQAALSY